MDGWLGGKPRRLGLPNGIVDDLDSKQSEFEPGFWSDSQSDDKIISY